MFSINHVSKPTVTISCTGSYTATVVSDSRSSLMKWWKANQYKTLSNQLVADRCERANVCKLRVRLEGQNKGTKIAEILKKAGISCEINIPLTKQKYSRELVLKNLSEVYKIGGKPYQITRLISSRGCYGDVFLAIDMKSREHVAIKVLRVDGDGEYAELRKMEERGGHPNIVRYIGSGTVMQKKWIVMEYLDGEMLGKYLTHSKWSKELESQKQSALIFMHKAGVQTARENPRENIMVLKDEEGPKVKLIDFGTLARG